MGMTDKSVNVHAARGAQCGCGPARKTGACSLAAPAPYQAACHPAPLHRSPCQSDAYFPMNVAYGQW